MRTRDLIPLAICLGIFVAGNVVSAEALAGAKTAAPTQTCAVAVAYHPASQTETPRQEQHARAPECIALAR
ncbi:MAG TPA: hypothetical protein VF665_24620 [Longimicrobium sp.]|jgi:hypothetical protein|uniref:hypothetical protein n=1 Tax=Longimicrobium sp. TaxID=2029185 RepID=UPI002EDAF106